MLRIPFGLVVVIAWLGWSASSQAQGPVKSKGTDIYGSITPGGVVSGYGNYWFPSIYPYPSVGGPGYINYGPGGALTTYFSVPATPYSAAKSTSNRIGGLAGTIPKVVTPPKSSSGGGKEPAAKPIPRKPRESNPPGRGEGPIRARNAK